MIARLDEPAAAAVEAAGGKGSSLARMAALGLPVPAASWCWPTPSPSPGDRGDRRPAARVPLRGRRRRAAAGQRDGLGAGAGRAAGAMEAAIA